MTACDLSPCPLGHKSVTTITAPTRPLFWHRTMYPLTYSKECLILYRWYWVIDRFISPLSANTRTPDINQGPKSKRGSCSKRGQLAKAWRLGVEMLCPSSNFMWWIFSRLTQINYHNTLSYTYSYIYKLHIVLTSYIHYIISLQQCARKPWLDNSTMDSFPFSPVQMQCQYHSKKTEHINHIHRISVSYHYQLYHYHLSMMKWNRRMKWKMKKKINKCLIYLCLILIAL